MMKHMTTTLLMVMLVRLSVDANQHSDILSRWAMMQACSAISRPLVFTDSSGTFTSPDYPNNYPNNVLCQWLIILPDLDKVVQLNFEALSTEARNDTIVIYDGSDADPQKILTGFDGDTWNPLPNAINSNGHQVLFEFKTNSVVSGTGFKVSYTSADISVLANDPCSVPSRPLLLSEYSGVFESKGFPHYYYNYADCQWLIESPEPDGVILLDFTYFYTEFFFDRVVIHDGKDTTAPVIKTFHGSESPPPVGLRSTQKFMFVHFQSDHRDVAPGFQARFTSQAADDSV